MRILIEEHQYQAEQIRDVFGRELRTTRYGSATSEMKRFHQSSTAVSVPRIVPRRKPITVSRSVVPICRKREPSRIILTAVANNSVGWLKRKGSIQPQSAAISQRRKNRTSKSACKSQTAAFLFCVRRRYAVCSLEMCSFS